MSNLSQLGPLPLTLPEKKRDRLVFLLGARDPEMDEIEKILQEGSHPYRYAVANGVRVHPGNAYKADPIALEEGTTLVLVECEPRDFKGHQALIRFIDHHNPGDPGYNLAPEFFWEASSIGQLYQLLGKGIPTREHLLLAATDHCMVHARNGKCPGISSQEAATFSQELTARQKGVQLSDVQKCINEMGKEIAQSPRIVIGNQSVIDLTATTTGVGYSLRYLCAREAFANLHIAGLIKNQNEENAPIKIMLCGEVEDSTFEGFETAWAPENGLTDIIIVRNRGYAVGFLK